MLPGTLSLACVWIICRLMPWAWTLFPLVPVLPCDLGNSPAWIQSKCTEVHSPLVPSLLLWPPGPHCSYYFRWQQPPHCPLCPLSCPLIFSTVTTRQIFNAWAHVTPRFQFICDSLGPCKEVWALCCSHPHPTCLPHCPPQVLPEASWADPFTPQGLGSSSAGNIPVILVTLSFWKVPKLFRCLWFLLYGLCWSWICNPSASRVLRAHAIIAHAIVTAVLIEYFIF